MSLMYDCVIIGGGFYGCMIALELRKHFNKIAIIEQENDILQRASFTNQARVHMGYHYPRSLLTAFSSFKNFTLFCNDFKQAITKNFNKYYAIARIGSKTTSKQFYHIFKNMKTPISIAPSHIKAFFNKKLIEEVFCVQEYAFNSTILKQILAKKLHQANITLYMNTTAQKVIQRSNKIIIQSQTKDIESTFVFNCTYAGLNTLLHNSSLALLNLKVEITEMALVEMPNLLKDLSVTIMDGQFFSFMPFPAKNLYTLSHVRYTPHTSWLDIKQYHNAYEVLQHYKKQSNFVYMLHDCIRYMPLLQECIYKESLFEAKIIRAPNEKDDGRPILFAKDYGIKNFFNVLGGKIDNIYDILYNLRQLQWDKI